MSKTPKMMSKSEKGTNTLYLPNEHFFKNSNTSFKKHHYHFKLHVCMYVCNAILNIGLPSTYSLMALESKGGYVCKHFVLTFFCKIFSTFFDGKTEQNNG